MTRKTSIIAGAILVISLAVAPVIADDDATVTKIVAETADSIIFQVSVSKTKFRRGEDITVDYAVTNKNDRTVYLVTDPAFTNVQVKETGILEIFDPIIRPDPHEKFSYDLIEIRPKETYKSKLLISAKIYLSDKNYDFEDAGIRAGFAYLFDVSKLTGCKQATYTLPCLTEVYDKSKTVTLGTLFVEIPDK